MTWPNKSPEPTAVGAACQPATGSAVAVHFASRRWLRFFVGRNFRRLAVFH